MVFPSKYLSIKLLFFFLFLQGITNSLQANDSLRHLLQTNLTDTTRIDVLGQLSRATLGTAIDSSIVYAKQAAALAEKINDVERKGYMLKNVGIGYYYKGDFVETLSYWFASLAAFKQINHLKGISNLLGNIGGVYNSTGEYPKSIDYHLKSLRIAEENKDDFRKATALQNIGAVYSNMGEFALSKKYYEEALVMCRAINYEKGIATVVMNLSEVYRNMNLLDKALDHVTEAKVLFEKLQDPSLPEAMIASSYIYHLQKKYAKAISEAKEGYAIADKNDSKSFKQRALTTLGNAYYAIQKIPLAITAYEEAAQLGQAIGVNIDMLENYKGLKNAYEAVGDYKNAFATQDSLLSVTRELYNIEKNDKIANLQLEFNLEKRETEIALLNADNEIKNQALTQATLQRNFFSAIALFLIALLGGVAYMYQYARKKNKIISEERNKSDHLLKNILPPETAEELKKNGVVQPKKYDDVTVLFTDFVGFTKKAAFHSPEIIVSSIDYYFKRFDTIIAKNQLEKIKTMGDAYMCAGGLHTEGKSKDVIVKNTLNAASEIVQFITQTAANPPKDIVPFQIRIGIDSGPVVAGVVGQTKFQYDIWGDTVNVAARMEANCQPNKINVSENIYQQLKEKLSFLYRGTIDVKNKGLMKMYFYGEHSKELVETISL